MENLQSLRMIVSPLADKIKNCESMFLIKAIINKFNNDFLILRGLHARRHHSAQRL